MHQAFAAAIGEGHPFGRFLTRMFKRKIKRRARNAGEGTGSGGEGSDDDESDSDEDEYSSSSEESMNSDEGDGVFDDTVCPDGLDEALYEKVAALRERRLDAEEALAEEKRTADLQRKESDVAAKKEKGLIAALEAAEAEVEALQLEKQARLNELYVSVPLRMEQVFNHVHGDLPADLSDSLIFAKANIEALQQRIGALTQEKSQRRREFKEIHASQV